MATRQLLRVIVLAGAVAATVGVTQTATGQVVINMPPPPPPAQLAAAPVRATVDVGDVALYRYSATRFPPHPTGPRFYQQHTRYDLFPPYHLFGFAGHCFLRPPVIFDFRRPFPMRGFRFEMHK